MGIWKYIFTYSPLGVLQYTCIIIAFATPIGISLFKILSNYKGCAFMLSNLVLRWDSVTMPELLK